VVSAGSSTGVSPWACRHCYAGRYNDGQDYVWDSFAHLYLCFCCVVLVLLLLSDVPGALTPGWKNSQIQVRRYRSINQLALRGKLRGVPIAQKRQIHPSIRVFSKNAVLQAQNAPDKKDNKTFFINGLL
jgi:hypothetical protein